MVGGVVETEGGLDARDDIFGWWKFGLADEVLARGVEAGWQFGDHEDRE